MSADQIKYMDVLIIAKVKEGSLDLPFPIFSCTAVKDNRVYYSLEGLKDGDTVLANVHVSIDQFDEISRLPEAIKGFQNDKRVRDFWTVIKQDGLATSDEEGNVKLYEGKDALELMPFCVSNLMC